MANLILIESKPPNVNHTYNKMFCCALIVFFNIQLEHKSDSFLSVAVKAVNDPTEFFTDQIRAAFKDPEPNDYQLIRLLVARSEVMFHSLIC
jgi:hypothetical protein